MKLSGFTFVRNAEKLYYPVKESIQSVLPLVDEFYVALGPSDPGDNTRAIIESIGSDKIRIIESEWQAEYMKDGAIYAKQTDLARSYCTGDWHIYMQADEVMHESGYEAILRNCGRYLDDERVEGMLTDYKHFWGDYGHYHGGHGWYPKEIRIVRNKPSIHSWGDAQSFRHYDTYRRPHQNDDTRKLKVVESGAAVFHYGWVRPPYLMQSKRKTMEGHYHGKENVEKKYEGQSFEFDYGPLDRLARFRGTHPWVMKERIGQLFWQEKLQQSGRPDPAREPHKHERFSYRAVSFLENTFLFGRKIGTFRNYELVR